MTYTTAIKDYTIRMAREKDVSLVLQFIMDLASYENLQHEVGATEETIKEILFDRKIAEAVIGEYQDQPVGFALYYFSVSTFIGRPAIYIEDLFVNPDFRGKGFGKALFSCLARLAKERNCWGLEWACLDWNQPSIKFYQSLGAVPRSDWTTYRIRGEALDRLATEQK